MKNHWLDEAKKRLEADLSEPSDVHFQRLQEQGLINGQGEVTGRLHRWTAYLAVTAVKHDSSGRVITSFRCLKPVFGMPGGATIDVRRESMLEYLNQEKKIITACRDERLNMWKESCEVHLSPHGFIRIDESDELQDNLGDVPEFRQEHTSL